MSISEQLKRSFAITKKDLSIYYLRAPVMIQGLIIPGFLFLSFSFKRDTTLSFLMPGLLGMALFFAVSAITPVIAPWETKMKTLERLVSTPISFWAILLGDVISSVIFGLFIAGIILAIAIFMLGFGILNFYLIAGTIIAAFTFSALGILISASAVDQPSDVMLTATLIKFPLIFISGVFVPISEMGQFKILSFISPLTYYTDIVRYSMQDINQFSPIVSLLVLSAFAVLLFFLAIVWHQRNLSERF